MGSSIVVARSEVRRLYRSSEDRVLAGVCAGLAEHLRVDVRTVRIVFAALTLAGGAGLVLYAAFWALVPQQPEGAQQPRPVHSHRRRRRHLDRGDVVAFSLLAAGGLLLAQQLGVWLGGAVVWPVAATAAGVALIWRQADEAQRARWSESARRPLLGSGDRRVALARLAAGGVLVAAGVGGLLATQDGFRAARDGILAMLAAVIGLALITGPWWWRLAINIARKPGLLSHHYVRTTGIRCMPICAGAVIRPIRRRISRRSSSSACSKADISIAPTRRRVVFDRLF